jgi:hypothetical protein
MQSGLSLKMKIISLTRQDKDLIRENVPFIEIFHPRKTELINISIRSALVDCIMALQLLG